jgi:hypothetical protein
MRGDNPGCILCKDQHLRCTGGTRGRKWTCMRGPEMRQLAKVGVDSN